MKVKLILSAITLCLLLNPTRVSTQDTSWSKHVDAGLAATKQGRLEDAERHYEAALKEAEKVGDQNWRLAASFLNLAGTYKLQRRYSEAERLYKRAIIVYQKVRGPEHVDMTLTLNGLAKLYIDTGKYDEAEPLLKQALTITEKVKGPEHLACF